MPAPRQPKTIQILNSKSTLAVLIVFLLFLAWAYLKENQSQEKIIERQNSIDQEISQLEQQNQELESLLEYFSSQEFIEKEARQKLNLAKPNEKVVIITQGEPQVLTEDKTKKQLEKLPASPQLWWQYFFSF